MADVPQNTQVTGFVHKELDWFKHHLISLAIIVALSFGAIYGVESMMANARHEAWLQVQAISDAKDKANAQVQSDNEKKYEAVLQQNAVLQQQVVQILNVNAQLTANLEKQKVEIKTLPAPALAAKWGGAAEEPAPQIDAQGQFIVPLPLAQKSVIALVSVPVLQTENKNLADGLAKETTIANNNASSLDSEKKAHTSDNDTCKVDKDTLKAEIKDVKAQARKGKLKWFFIGLVTGFMGSHLKP